MKKFVNVFAGAALLLTSGPIPNIVHAADKLDLRVTPSVSIAPASVVVRAIVEHDRDNRALEIVADSLDFYRRTVVDLDGEQAPKTTEVKLMDIPGGQYDVSATLYMADGTKTTVRRSVTVMSSPSPSLR